MFPSYHPSNRPSLKPTRQPTRHPTRLPTRQPTEQPTLRPTKQPTIQPTRQPTRTPTRQPTRVPTRRPTRQPTNQPTRQPTKQPTRQPTKQPTRQPTKQPTRQPTRQPSRKPTRQPTNQPTRLTTTQPTTIFCLGLSTYSVNNHKYLVVTSPTTTWTAANTTMASLPKCCGGKTPHLVTFSTSGENSFVAGLSGGSTLAWIGLSDIGSDQTFRWVTGESVTYTNWNSNQPVTVVGSSDCASMALSNGRWSSTACTISRPYVVEYDC